MKGYRCLGLILLTIGLPAYSHATNKIQDTAAATRYFESELNFSTNPHGLNSLITSKEKEQPFTIVDLRAESDYKNGHIPGAINIPYDKWDGFKGDQKEFPGLRKDGINYVYCYEILCNLGQVAGKKFASLGYPVKEMKGGFQEWKKRRYPVEK